MTLAFTRGLAPETPFLMAALLRDRRARRPRGRSWLRIAHRLAAGLPPAAAALPEGANEQLVLRLLRHEEFSGFVEAAREELALPAEEQRRQLVISARQTMERLLAWDDAPTAIFILDQECRNLDPAETLVDAILKARTRTVPRGPKPKPNPRPDRPRDSLATLMHHGTARLRQEIETESALRHAALAAAPPPARTTAEAARHALALKRAADNRARCRPHQCPTRRCRHRPGPSRSRGARATRRLAVDRPRCPRRNAEIANFPPCKRSLAAVANARPILAASVSQPPRGWAMTCGSRHECQHDRHEWIDLMTQGELLQRITADPRILGGKPVVRGLRISVELVVALLAAGETAETILDDYPELEPEDLRAGVSYVDAVITGESIKAIQLRSR